MRSSDATWTKCYEMNCKYCNNKIPDESIFCMYCGERVARKKKTKKQEIKVPEPRQLKSGAWNIELRKEGESITEPTREACLARARAVRAGFVKKEKTLPKLPLKTFLRAYIDAAEPSLSPSTVSGYESIWENRYQDYMDKDIGSIDWQAMVNQDIGDVAPKTVRNDWGLITAAFDYSGIPRPKVKLPAVPKSDKDFFDFEQIPIFLEAVKGRKCELACLLALHSLRMSEIMAIKQTSIVDGFIQVRGAVVRNKDNQYVYRELNKTDRSRRDVPVMIPRLTEIWPAEGEQPVFQKHSAANSMLQDVCEKAGLPVLSMHELRHSFASLAWHLKWDMMTTCAIGGWSNTDTVQKIYTHLSQKDKNTNIERMKRFYKRHFTNEITNKSKKSR